MVLNVNYFQRKITKNGTYVVKNPKEQIKKYQKRKNINSGK